LSFYHENRLEDSTIAAADDAAADSTTTDGTASDGTTNAAADATDGAAETVVIVVIGTLDEELHGGQAVALDGAAEGDVAPAAAVVHGAAEGDAAAQEVVLGDAVDVGGVDGGGGADDGGVGQLAQDAAAALAVEVAGVGGAAGEGRIGYNMENHR